MAETPDNSGVRFPPPLIYVAGLVAAYFLQRVHPLTWDFPERQSFWKDPSTFIGIAFCLTGLFVIRSAARTVWKANSSIIPMRPTTAIVTEGMFRTTRNPMYVGLAIIYLGVGTLMFSVWPWALAPLVIIAVDRLVIAKEERYLRGKFGETYGNYCSRVRRWI
jgi:protein-S-isoprenylcysteine O-methyltransferase Ste14